MHLFRCLHSSFSIIPYFCHSYHEHKAQKLNHEQDLHMFEHYCVPSMSNQYDLKMGVPVFLAVGSQANSLIVTLGNIHCIQRLTFPLVPPMLLVFCSRVTVSANGPSSPAGIESP